jgi:hypothetical protein
MAREVDQAKLSTYTGKFALNPSTLQQNVKAANPDYDPHDPKTWPVVTLEHVNRHIFSYFGHTLLPPCVAYERKLIDMCVARNPDKYIEVECSDGTTIVRSMYFHHFPFVYNNRGKKRNFEYMHADHYTSWVHGVTGKTPKTRTKGKDSSSSPADTFTEILDLIREVQPESLSDEIAALQLELTAMQHNLVDERMRADAAENNKDRLEKRLAEETRRVESVAQSSKEVRENLRVLLQDERDKHSATQGKLTIAEEATRTLNSQLEDRRSIVSLCEECLLEEKKASKTTKIELATRTAELEAVKRSNRDAYNKQAKELEEAKKEASTAMNIIRDELKKVKVAGARKRQADDDADEVPGKKIKSED